MCCKDVIITLGLPERLTKRNYRPAVVYGDNKPAIAQAKTPGAAKLKHVENLNYHCVKDMVAQKKILLNWVKTDDQLADIYQCLSG